MKSIVEVSFLTTTDDLITKVKRISQIFDRSFDMCGINSIGRKPSSKFVFDPYFSFTSIDQIQELNQILCTRIDFKDKIKFHQIYFSRFKETKKFIQIICDDCHIDRINVFDVFQIFTEKFQLCQAIIKFCSQFKIREILQENPKIRSSLTKKIFISRSSGTIFQSK